MKAIFYRAICLALVLSLFAGCATPGRRAKQHANAFRRLSPSDQHLVLKGKIRPGLSKEAVYIAWGEPDWKLQGGKGSEQCESWIYYRELTIYQAFNSYDVHTSTAGLLQPNFRLGLRDFGGVNGDLQGDGFLYAPRLMVNDVRLKRADFRDGTLHNFTVRRGTHLIPSVVQ